MFFGLKRKYVKDVVFVFFDWKNSGIKSTFGMKSFKQLLFVWHEKDKATVELVSKDFVEGAKGLVLGGEKMWKVFRVFLWVWKGTNKIVPKSMSRLQYLKTLKTNYKPNEQNTQTHLKNTQNQKTKLLNTLWRTTQNQFKAIKNGAGILLCHFLVFVLEVFPGFSAWLIGCLDIWFSNQNLKILNPY